VPDTLLFGIGNSGRSDDGLGWSFLDRIKQETDFAGQFEYRYQLQVEDAALVRDAERVIFIDSYKGELPGGGASCIFASNSMAKNRERTY